ncbi:MAG: AAA family ATPase [Planctomycetes bacterium]|nr:AAA family ATPase [Planctomycetota bacterium]
MIVRSLHATGFMRYQELDLDNLPNGVIALEGDNESGKTTLGEAVAFALFGRTIRTEDTDPTQAINWDVDECKISIEFEVPEQGMFKVERVVRRTGEFEAVLSGAQGVIAETPREVTEALSEIIGFDFPTFRYSFYVAQGELDLVRREGRDNAQRIVHDMLGITTIERARTLLETELKELEERGSTFERDLIVATALHTDALPLKAELERLEGERERSRETLVLAEETAGQALAESQRSDAAQAAYRERTGALGRLERALVADTQRQALLRARAKLRAYSSRTDDLFGQAEAAIKMDAAPRAKAKEDLTQAEGVDRLARRLLTIVKHHGAELSAETSDSVAFSLLSPFHTGQKKLTLLQERIQLRQ